MQQPQMQQISNKLYQQYPINYQHPNIQYIQQMTPYQLIQYTQQMTPQQFMQFTQQITPHQSMQLQQLQQFQMRQFQMQQQNNNKQIPLGVQNNIMQMKQNPPKTDIVNIINKLDAVCKSKEEQENILR
jgi:hypothetical protein